MRNYILANPNQFINNFFDEFFTPAAESIEKSMATDARKTENGIELYVDLAGFKKEEVELKYEKGYLTVTAKKSEDNKDDKSFLMRERSVIKSRTYYVGEVNEDGITAKLDGGVLSVALPKKVEVENKKTIVIE